MKKNLLGLFIIISLIVSGWLGGAHAAIDLVGASCTLSAKGSISATQFGTDKITGYLFVHFYQNGYVELIDEDDYMIIGQYGFDSDDNFFINIPPWSIENFIYDSLGTSYGVNIDVTQSITKATLKDKKGDLSLSLSFKFIARLDVNGYEKTIKIKYNINSKGTFPPDGSSWLIDNNETFKLGKIKQADESTWLLHLGPNDDEGLSGNEFIIYEANGTGWDYVIGGHITRSGKKVTFITDNDDFYDLLDERAAETINDTDFDYAYVWDCMDKFTATIKSGLGITFKGKSKFVCEVSNYVEYDDWKGSYSVKGKGIPTQ